VFGSDIEDVLERGGRPSLPSVGKRRRSNVALVSGAVTFGHLPSRFGVRIRFSSVTVVVPSRGVP